MTPEPAIRDKKKLPARGAGFLSIGKRDQRRTVNWKGTLMVVFTGI